MAESKYEEYIKPRLDEITFWKRNGISDEEVAKALGISRQSLYNYRKQHEELRVALKEGKERACAIIENTLFKRALGYEYEETFKELVKDEKTGNEEYKVVKINKKSVPPSDSLLQFLSKNWMPDRYKDSKDIKHGVDESLEAILKRCEGNEY